MLYYFVEYLRELGVDFSGMGLFRYISFRAGLAVLLSLFLALFYGKKFIRFIAEKQMRESIRQLGLAGEKQKEGTPTMGGLIIIFSTLIPVLLLAKLDNIYIILLIIATIWMGLIGFWDDYLKIFHQNKVGLRGIFKVIGQVGLGLIVGVTMYMHSGVVSKSAPTHGKPAIERREMVSTVPFLKNNELQYSKLLFWLEKTQAEKWAWLVFIPIVIFIITAVSNGVNLTDGIDGLAAGTSAIVLLTLALFAYLSGNIIFANYLNIMLLPDMGEVVIFAIAMSGAVLGFFWYNTYPAQIFMGDTGSLTLGGVIAVLAIILRKELLIPVLCGVFLVENLSVIVQVSYFKWTKRKYGEGRRILKMSPLHHHYQKGGYHESKIVNRFIIIGFILAVVSIITLKVR